MRWGLFWVTCGLVLGLAAGVTAGYSYWGRAAAASAERLAALEASTAQVQAERERLHHELTDIVRERQEMAAAADHLRSQVERQLHRLESLAQELEHPGDEEGAAGDAPPPPVP